jgi:hypothetical protein
VDERLTGGPRHWHVILGEKEIADELKKRGMESN